VPLAVQDQDDWVVGNAGNCFYTGQIMTDETWGNAKNDLLKRIGNNNFVTWIEPMRLCGIDAGVARFEVPTVFFGDWVSRNYSDQIRSDLNRLGETVDRVEFSVGQASRGNGAPRASAGAVAARARTAPEEDLRGAALDARFTFDSFVVGKPNELAHAAARRVAEGGPVTFNPLFLYGGVGLGKTHLMHAIAHELQVRNPELRVLYLSAEQFMYRFVQALRERQIMGFKELFRSVDVLMVDDVQFIAG